MMAIVSVLLCFIVMCCGGHLLEKEESAVSTIVVRGSTDNIMDDIERAVDDGINTFRTIIKVVTCDGVWLMPSLKILYVHTLQKSVVKISNYPV